MRTRLRYRTTQTILYILFTGGCIASTAGKHTLLLRIRIGPWLYCMMASQAVHLHNAGDATPFDEILNFRDVGAYINSKMGSELLRSDMLYRSARPDSATPKDRALLLADYHVCTIIDLRTPTEHVDARRKHAEKPCTNPDHPLRIPGIKYKDINFNGLSYSCALIKQLSWLHTANFVTLYTVGCRKRAISVLGKNVMARGGLTGFAKDSLLYCTKEVRAVFDVLADENAYPLTLHCTQGKDRTGLVVLLTLLLLRVPIEVAKEDYGLSESQLKPERKERLVELRSIGLPVSFADCPPDWVSTVSGWIDERYGGIEKYLKSCGVAQAQQDRVKRILRPD